MYDYEEIAKTMVGMVDVYIYIYIHELMLVDEDDNLENVKRILDSIEKCQVSLQWIDMYLRASEQLKPLLQPILDYYLEGLKKLLLIRSNNIVYYRHLKIIFRRKMV